MSRQNNQKINYAQAAAQPKSHINNTHHQNQQHNHQQSSQQNQTSGTPASSNFTPSANGKSNKSQTKPQAQHNSTMGNGSTGRSAPIKKNSVQLPTNGHAWEKAPAIEFGSVNTPNTQLSASTGPALTSGGGLPATLPTKVVPSFGTLSNTNTINTQAIQASTTVGTTGPGANNNNSISNNNNNNNGVSKSIPARGMDIPRTHSAPPQFDRNVGQSGHIPNVGPTRTQPNNIHQQQPAAISHQPSSVSVSNPPLNHRKDSVSSTVSSNDGQQQPYHPHHSPQHHNHSRHYSQHQQHQQHPHHKSSMQPNQQYRPRGDKNNIPQHLNSAQAVPAQGSIPMAPGHMGYLYNREYHMPQYYAPPFNMVIPQYHYQIHPRPQMTQPHIPSQPPPVSNNYKNTTKERENKAIPIIDPNKSAPININYQHKVYQKREEAPVAVFDKKPEESEKEKPSSEDKGNSKAVPIIDPADKDKEERERKERERIAKEKEKAEQERKERERLEAERKEREEKERKEQEEKERLAKEKEEQERREREERERKEREEQERIAKEKEEQERKEREERERLEAERKEKEERERKEREEREERERLEAERKEKEEKERKEREERERLEKERKEKEEKERKEREEKERLEKEKKEKEEKERKEREEKERLEKERLEAERKEEEEKARKLQEEKEKEEIERKKKEEEEAKAKAASEDEKKKETESVDSKKEEKKFNKGHRPGPLDLSRTTSAPAIPSALGSARIIDDLNSVQYPEGILSPNPALNSNAEPGKFKYDRSFLMQFMGVCKEKPENLPALEAIGMEESKDDRKKPTRNGTNPRSLHKGSPTQFQMGEFKSPLKTSEERFAMSNMRNGTSSGAGIFGRAPLGRTGSGSTILPTPTMSNTTNQSPNRTPSGRVTTRKSGRSSSHQVQNVGQEQVAPLERSENRWVPSQMADPLPNKTNESFIPIDGIQRKVKALLNKLTLEKFDSISDQIVDYANKSRDEKDGRILREVIRLIFEKSCDESNFCAMYAQLCRKMMERVDPEIVDENVKNTEGKFVQGGTLFRKYLLNRCQEDFEKGWKVNVPVPSNEKGEPDLMSDEYYAAAKAKRQGLGLIRFIGELFKLNMLTERIMHECIKKLLIFQGSPEEEEMESLCKLMNTVGEQLDHVKTNPQEHIKQNQIDHAKAKQLMESYFSRMEEITRLPNLSSRIKFMIMDVIDLRNNSWKPRRDINAPKTIAEIHEDAAKQKEEAEFLRRSASSGGRLPKMSEQMSRSGSGRRDHKGMPPHGSSVSNDGWINVGGTSQRNKDKVGDLTKFGSVNRGKITGGNVSLAPGGILTGLSGGAKGWNSEKDGGGKNMYSVLNSESSEGRKSSETPSSEVQKSSPPTERKKIILAPRTKAIPTEEPTKSVLKSNSEAAPSVQSMTEELAKRKINVMMEEYFSVKDIKEVAQCLKEEIPAEYHATAIETIANKVIEKKQKDVDDVMKLFKELTSSGTCELDAFKNGFKATLDFLMDIGTDAPMSYSFTGQLLFSTGLDFRDITKLLKQLDDDKAVEKIVGGYAVALKKDDEQKYVQKIKELDFISLFPKKNKDDINKYLDGLVR